MCCLAVYVVAANIFVLIVFCRKFGILQEYISYQYYLVWKLFISITNNVLVHRYRKNVVAMVVVECSIINRLRNIKKWSSIIYDPNVYWVMEVYLSNISPVYWPQCKCLLKRTLIRCKHTLKFLASRVMMEAFEV